MNGRGFAAGVLVLIGCLASVVAVPAQWADRQLRSESYADSAGPLIKDAEVQVVVAARVTAEVRRAVDLPGVSQQGLDTLAELGVPSELLDQVRGAVKPVEAALAALVEKEVRGTLASPVADRVWASALRDTRDAIVSGTAPGNVVVDLRPLIEEVKRRLVADGLEVAAQVRPPSTRVVVMPDTTVTTAREWYGGIRTLAVAMPIVAVVSLLLALAVAVRRVPVVLAFAVGTAAGMGAIALVLAQARQPYLESLPAEERTVVGAVYDAFADSLRRDVWWVFGVAIGLTLVLLAVLAARGRSAGRRDEARMPSRYAA
jgi:hypothetical protein